MQFFSSSTRASQNDEHECQSPNCAPESQFLDSLRWERKRCERSGNALLLVLVHFEHRMDTPLSRNSINIAVRSTDTVGWYEQSKTLGLLLTDVRSTPKRDPRTSFEPRLRAALCKLCASEHQPEITFHYFPRPGQHASASSSSAIFYPDDQRGSTSQVVKRCVDIAGSLSLLVLLAPILATIAIAVKLSSRGPVWHRQTRMGAGGRSFTMLKFRTMFENCDSTAHREYVTSMIAGKEVPCVRMEKGSVYKLVNDPRVTPVGKLLRRSSLDELPQLLNILRGEMSLVGPRPPLPYEFERYSAWHRRRVMEVKPGLTGLWQVRGRCRTSFDEMVRLDLQYIQEWSLWLDAQILLETPLAVLSGTGAY